MWSTIRRKPATDSLFLRQETTNTKTASRESAVARDLQSRGRESTLVARFYGGPV